MGVCEHVFMRFARTPRELRARFMRVRASEIYKRNARTSLRCVGETFMSEEHLSRVTDDIGRYIFSLFFVWRNFCDLWFIGFLRFNFWFGIFDFS